MIYNDLQIIAKSKGILIKDLADSLGLTSNGLKRSIESGKFPIEKVMPLCQTLGITVSEFFGEAPQLTTGNYAAHISGGNTQNSNEAILALKDQLKEKDKQISRLLTIIERSKPK
jgi:transcriptional regulator with XRE-family HTH domain